ncbi:hypothetical protein ACFSTC_45040 [Nonomuraea ferruginea]
MREDVVALVERARDSGMAITLRLERPIPGLAHRVVQEGLTNVAKHAPGAVIEVAVTPHLVAVRNGPPAHAPPGHRDRRLRPAGAEGAGAPGGRHPPSQPSGRRLRTGRGTAVSPPYGSSDVRSCSPRTGERDPPARVRPASGRKSSLGGMNETPRAGVGRVTAAIVAMAAMLPYLTLKVLWLTGSPVGVTDPALMDDSAMYGMNVLTFGMDAVALVLALGFTMRWGDAAARLAGAAAAVGRHRPARRDRGHDAAGAAARRGGSVRRRRPDRALGLRHGLRRVHRAGASDSWPLSCSTPGTAGPPSSPPPPRPRTSR